MKHVFFCVLCLLTAGQMPAQNVGIGIQTPADRLHLHGGNSYTSSVAFTNNASGAAIGNAMRVGIQFQADNTSNQYGFINLPAAMPFYIWQSNVARFSLGPNGHIGINTKPYAPYALSVAGPALIMPGHGDLAAVTIADTMVNSGAPAGLSVQKVTPGGQHFFTMSLDGNRSMGRLEANFKNAQALETTTSLQFDSSGQVGIGKGIYGKTLRSSFHVFGTQRIESAFGGTLQLLGFDDNFTYGSELRLAYNNSGFESSEALPGLSQRHHYFIRLNDNSAVPSDRNRSLAIGRFRSTPFGWPGGLAYDNDIVAIAQAPNGNIGIGQYPSAANSNVRIFMRGNTQINGHRLTLDRSTSDEVTTNSIEFRNGGAYRYGFGYDAANDRFFLYEGKSNSNPLIINNGRMGINRNPTTNTLEVNGTASKASAGDWLANSDARLKKNIMPIANPLEKILQLQGITYEWNDTKTGITRPAGLQMGFTAQNIQRVFPELVNADEQGFLQTSYGTYDALLIEAIKVLSSKITILEEKMAVLQAKL